MNIHKIISIRNISFLCNKFKNWLDSFIFGIDDLPYRWQLQVFFFFFLLWVLQSRLLRYYHCCLRQKHDSLNVVYFLRMFLALLTLDYGNYSLEALNISNVMRDSYFENRTRTYFTHTHICVCELGGGASLSYLIYTHILCIILRWFTIHAHILLVCGAQAKMKAAVSNVDASQSS